MFVVIEEEPRSYPGHTRLGGAMPAPVGSGIDAVSALTHPTPDSVAAPRVVEEQSCAPFAFALTQAGDIGATKEFDPVARDDCEHASGVAVPAEASGPEELGHRRRLGGEAIEESAVGSLGAPPAEDRDRDAIDRLPKVDGDRKVSIGDRRDRVDHTGGGCPGGERGRIGEELLGPTTAEHQRRREVKREPAAAKREGRRVRVPARLGVLYHRHYLR